MLYQLFASVALLSSVLSQNTTCHPIQESDPICGVFVGAEYVLYPEQAQSLVDNYIPKLTAACEDITKVMDIFPLLFCIGSMGNCHNGEFVLPKVDEDGNPESMQAVAAYYNNARYGKIVPSLQKANVKPPCFQQCQKSIEVIQQCPTFKPMGIKPGTDVCDGLPKTDCVALPGYGPNYVPAAAEKTKTKKADDKKAAANGAAMNSAALVFTIACLALVL